MTEKKIFQCCVVLLKIEFFLQLSVAHLKVTNYAGKNEKCVLYFNSLLPTIKKKCEI